MENMKNMIILKDLPSNLVEEAIIILKENKKIHKYETINKKSSNQNQKEDKTGYIVKDAEMIIKSYIDNLEKKSPKFTSNMKKLERKYKNSIKLNFFLLFTTILAIIFTLI